jgi:hypothetical protein
MFLQLGGELLARERLQASNTVSVIGIISIRSFQRQAAIGVMKIFVQEMA